MENYILNRKIIEIEKNKEYSFRIPTLFNAASCEFILEVPEDQLKENLYVELAMRNPLEPSSNKLKLVRTNLTHSVTKFRPRDVQEIQACDYLLFACKANHSVQLALSIVK